MKSKTSARDITKYYVVNAKKIMKDFDRLVAAAKEVVGLKYSPALVQKIAQNAKSALESLLPRLPSVGGDKSPFTALMIQSAETIAFYRASKDLGLSPHEWGKLIYEIAENAAQSISSIKKIIARKLIFSKKMKNYWRKWMAESQKREYPENWVGNFVEGDNGEFSYGLNFTECGWIKLAKKEDCEEILPYACLGDYAKMHELGIGFKRTKTLAAGADFCDFRFVKNYPTQRGWPPENLDENVGFCSKLREKKDPMH